MHLNFKIKSLGPNKKGLWMDIFPGQSPLGVMRREMKETGAISVQEGPFGFLEPAIKQHWPEYKNYGHWGRSIIPREVWLQIIATWVELGNSLAAEVSAGQVAGRALLLEDVKLEFVRRFDNYKVKLANMIKELSGWVLHQLSIHTHLTIEGI